MVAVGALALGIGANTAVFTVINTILLRPLPLPQADQLMAIFETTSQINQGSSSFLNLKDWREQEQVFQSIASYWPGSFTLKRGEVPVRTTGDYVSANYFNTIGIRPAIGRIFLPGEDQAGHNQVVVLSHSLWKNQFNADPDIIGQPILVNAESLTVIGVTPADFRFRLPNSEAQLWVPYVPSAVEASERGMRSILIIGRLKPEIKIQEAQSQMSVIARRLALQYPESNGDRGIIVVPLHEVIASGTRPALLMLMAAAGLVLLTACANVAALLLARMSERRKEIAVRMALGASRMRLIQQFLVESLLLLILSGTVAWFLALGGVHLLVLLRPGGLPLIEEIKPDIHVLVFTFVVSLITVLVLGLAMAFSVSRSNLQESLREGAIGTITHRRRLSLLVIAEVGIAVVLVIGAALLIESFWHIQQVHPGFEAEHVLTMQIALPESKYSEQHPVSTLYEPLLEKVQSLPGVESVGMISLLPIQSSGVNSGFLIEGRDHWPENQSPLAEIRAVSAGYF
ncbi:MAG: ABC transporter permease, partial [Pyrinomonadaceae bacterium]